MAWTSLRARKRPARLSDENHSLWEVKSEVLEGYPDLVRMRARYGDEFEAISVLNAKGEIVSFGVDELEE
jgi:hypothetical protein